MKRPRKQCAGEVLSVMPGPVCFFLAEAITQNRLSSVFGAGCNPTPNYNLRVVTL